MALKRVIAKNPNTFGFGGGTPRFRVWKPKQNKLLKGIRELNESHVLTILDQIGTLPGEHDQVRSLVFRQIREIVVKTDQLGAVEYIVWNGDKEKTIQIVVTYDCDNYNIFGEREQITLIPPQCGNKNLLFILLYNVCFCVFDCLK